MARPTITLTEDQRREMETLAALRKQDRIADYIGIPQNTSRAICARDEEGVACYKMGKAKAIAQVASGLLQKARSGDTTSAIYYLKTQASWRETVGGDLAGKVDTGGRDALAKQLDTIAERQKTDRHRGIPLRSRPPAVAGGDALVALLDLQFLYRWAVVMWLWGGGIRARRNDPAKQPLGTRGWVKLYGFGPANRPLRHLRVWPEFGPGGDFGHGDVLS